MSKQRLTKAHATRPMRVGAEEADMNCGLPWVRSSLSQLAVLRAARSVDVDAGQVIEFAIRWAPFGGAGNGDLLVTFDVGRRRFMGILQAGLRPRRTDNQESRWLKRTLLDMLTSAWRVDDASPAAPTHC